jgi:hypothetical protein
VYLVNPSVLANADGHGRGIWRHGAVARCGALALLLVLLGGCQGSAPAEGDGPAEPLPPGEYPDLASVPPRPRLTYTVEQRRAIGDQLVADRENARYRAAELAYDTGRSAEPPPPPPEAPAAPAAAPPPPPPPAGDGPIARAYVDDNLDTSRDTGKLRRFMRRLDRRLPDPVGPPSVAVAVGLAGPAGDTPAAGGAAPAAPAASPPQPQASALERFGGFLGGILGIGAGDEAAPASAPAAPQLPVSTSPPPPAAPEPAAGPPATLPAGSVVARVPFAAGSADPAAGAEAQLGRALELARAADTGLRIVAPPTQASLGMDRARTVAVGLMRLGAPADRLAVTTGGSGDEVLVYLAGSDAT